MMLCLLQASVPRYSLWLLPPEPMRAHLGALIQRLSERFRTPAFEPHLTLAGTAAEHDEDVTRRVEKFAASQTPIPVLLTDIAYTDEYFRCLYLRAAPNPALAAAHRRAAAALGSAADDFMPHLSLVYGLLTGADKERLVVELGRVWDISFTVGRLAVYAVDGRPDAWRRVTEFVLRGS